MMQNLLAAGGPGGGGRQLTDTTLVRFKAGKCETEARPGGKVWVKPVSRKGEVQLVKQDDLIHFQWRDRTTLAVDPQCDHMVFPGDAKFEKIDTGKQGDRCYVLQFQAQASRRFFFWMQQKDDADDAANVKTLNDAMNGAETSATESVPGPSVTQPETPAQTPQLTLDALQSVMSNLGMPPAPTSPAPPLRLTDVADADAVLASGVFDDQAVVDRLLPHLPPEQRTPDELRAVLRAPQFRQALGQLTAALATPDNFASILANFRLAPDPTVVPLDPVRAFLDAVQHTALQSNSNSSDSPDNETEMADAPPQPPPSSDD